MCCTGRIGRGSTSTTVICRELPTVNFISIIRLPTNGCRIRVPKVNTSPSCTTRCLMNFSTHHDFIVSISVVISLPSFLRYVVIGDFAWRVKGSSHAKPKPFLSSLASPHLDMRISRRSDPGTFYIPSRFHMRTKHFANRTGTFKLTRIP